MRKQRIATVLITMALLLSCLTGGSADSLTRTYEPDTQSMGNPLMGYAPCAWLSPKLIAGDTELLYLNFTWREWEPEKGVYAVSDIVQHNQLIRWLQEGKHIVFRFVCDLPGDEPHIDIPDWLYREIDGAGTHYDMEYGKGFSPDYTNETFIRHHDETIRAIGSIFGQDTFISYVQLGSLGHWGEWHVNYEAGIDRLPPKEVRDRYVQPYIDAFPYARLMMRRPFSHADENELGLYNDMSGHDEETERWFEWIEAGGEFTQTKEKDELAVMPDFWQTAPSGGEFTSSLSMKYMLQDHLEQTLELLRRSHTTFLGPKIADSEYPEGYARVLQTIGYRLHICQATLTEQPDGTLLEMTWENNGLAPMYFNWNVKACVLDAENRVIEAVDVPILLQDLLPESRIDCSVLLETKGIADGNQAGLRIGIGIVDPMTGRFAVRIDTLAERYDHMLILF